MNLNLLFFNISTGEIILIILVIFLIFGPGKIPEISKKVGRALFEVKKASSDIRREIDLEIKKMERKKTETTSEKTKNPPSKNK